MSHGPGKRLEDELVRNSSGVSGESQHLPWPRSIQAYTRLMSKSYLKSRLYEQLKLHGHIPDLDKDTDPATGIQPAFFHLHLIISYPWSLDYELVGTV